MSTTGFAAAPRLTRRHFLGGTAMAAVMLVAPAPVSAVSPLDRGALPPGRRMPFDDNWRFARADLPGAQLSTFNDASWKMVTLPHDWSIEDLPGAASSTGAWHPPAAIWNPQTAKRATQFDIQIPPALPDGPPLRVGPFDAHGSAGRGNTGWVVGGTAWYRKTFVTPILRSGERVEIAFDGAFRETEVWLNDVMLGSNVYGYAGFSFDLTEHLHKFGPNTLAVRVHNEGETSRWYSGSGLYRHVWLTVTGPVRIAPSGVWVQTPRIEPDHADAEIAVEIENDTASTRPVHVRIIVRDPSGQVVAKGSSSVDAAEPGMMQASATLRIPAPRLWGPDNPALYEVDVSIESSGQVTDKISTRFGIRKIAVSPERGLTINGVPVKLRGACIHADNGILGAAAIDRAEIRKVQLFKSFGYNALRMGHQMFSPAFMDACDEAGMLVIDEVFDTWEESKWLKDDYSQYFKTNWKTDLTRMVKQHRNHPSVIFWSIGNEIPETGTPRGVEIAALLRKTVLNLDSSRLITEAIAVPLVEGERGQAARRSLDVAGYNYGQDTYEADHQKDANLVLMGTEQWSRDMYSAWRKVEAYPWVIGEFIWTGMDYIGEVGSGSSELREIGSALPDESYVTSLWDYPAYLSGCGEIDITGRRKPQGLYRDVLWNRSSLELLVQRPTPPGTYERVSDWGWHDELESWTWPEASGRKMTVRAYTNGDRVTLILNGRTVADRPVVEENKLKVEIEVPYAPGTLTAIAYRDGSEIGRKTLETVGAPAQLCLRAERARIAASPDDLGYVFAQVCDAQGRQIPDATVSVTFTVTGPARLRATGSANPRGLKSFRSPECSTFHGEALAIIQPSTHRGACHVAVSSPGLSPAALTLAIG